MVYCKRLVVAYLKFQHKHVFIHRNYREPRIETPSFGGGVSKEYLDSQSFKKSREQAEKFRAGLAYKTGNPFQHKEKSIFAFPWPLHFNVSDLGLTTCRCGSEVLY